MARYVTRLSHNPVDRRVLHGAFSRLEPCAVKVASTVLRGRGDGNVTLLPDGPNPFGSGTRVERGKPDCPRKDAGKPPVRVGRWASG